MDDTLPGTIEQHFLIMLQERINVLENELLRLERLINRHQASRYHKIEVKMPLQDKTAKDIRNEIINCIFKHRKVFLPVFAGWTWRDSEEYVYMNFILTTQREVSESNMKQYLPNEDFYYQSFDDLYTFIQCFHYYFHDEDEGDETYSFEYWHFYYGLLHDFLKEPFTEEPFLESNNYTTNKMYQEKLRHWIFQHNSWVDILRIFI
jgi:hypothetical protein